ncbi:MAG: nucleotidyltransferase domain-containing protein [Acidobacteriota bacterium]|nr:nucleotidyltransferase domain-containing protein [Blastocatellia bacterium]MDW8240773.1 nucleotidyltransferase domain-containing protein [Acidobacteriota bacterium]
MNTQMLRQEIVEKLISFFDAKPEVTLAYLYGSFLRRDEWRDLDVAVWINEGMLMGRDAVDHVLRLGAELERFLGWPRVQVDVRLMNEMGPAFQYEVIRTGRLVKSVDRPTQVRYEARVMSEYLDFKWLLNVYDRRLLQEVRQW